MRICLWMCVFDTVVQAFGGVYYICRIDGDEFNGEGGNWRPAWELVQVRDREMLCLSEICFGSFRYFDELLVDHVVHVCVRPGFPYLER